jgi:hypothetical protein
MESADSGLANSRAMNIKKAVREVNRGPKQAGATLLLSLLRVWTIGFGRFNVRLALI